MSQTEQKGLQDAFKNFKTKNPCEARNLNSVAGVN